MIPFNCLHPLHDALAGDIEAAVRRVLQRGWFILGPEVEEFEAAFAAYQGGGYAVGVANGTDAVELALRAVGVGPGDEVMTVSHTAVATVCAVERTGATPVLVDIEADSYTMDPAAAAAAVTPRTKAIVPVHLYGHPADLTALEALAARHHLALIEDCAQAHGAHHQGRRVGTVGTLAAFSFYPTKNLGAYGDGGAVCTRDPDLAARLRRLRNYGQTNRYQHVERGINSRLDEMQAAILGVKLRHLDGHNAARRELAAAYTRGLRRVQTPSTRRGDHHVYHLYVVRSADRDALRRHLEAAGVGTLIHYPVPVHLQQAYEDLGYRAGSLPVTEAASREILSLPLYVGLTAADVARAVAAVEAFGQGLAA